MKINMLMNALLTLSSIIFPVITLPYVTRVLGAAGVGRVYNAASVISLFAVFAELGIPVYGIRACAKVRDDRAELSRTVREIMAVNLAVCAIVYMVFAAALFTVPAFQNDRLLLVIMSSSMLLNAIGVEWLYKRASKKRAKEMEVFYRDGNETTVHPKSQLLQELVTKKMVRDNALLLSTAAQFNEATAVSILHWLGDTKILFCSEDEELWKKAIKYLDDDEMRRRITTFARYADLGIEDITKTGNRIVSHHRQYDDDGREVNNVSFSFTSNESEGTIKYFSLAYPIIDALDNGKRVIIDELDSKLHPLLVKRIVALFNDAKTNPNGAQLLFTAHDTFLLSAGLFRRDQVWFTQKDSFGATELYSLAEYKVRSTSPFEKEYLHGRYGATPLIGEMEEIFNPSKQP